MLNLVGRPVPFAYGVPDEVYDQFKGYDNPDVITDSGTIKLIDTACKIHLENQIKDWMGQTIKELQAYESRERSLQFLKDTL